MVNRRQYLTGTGALLTAGFAGCLSSSESVPITITEDSPLFSNITVGEYGTVMTEHEVTVELSERGVREIDALNLFVNGDIEDMENFHVGQSIVELHPYDDISEKQCEIVGISNEKYVDRIVFRVE